MTSTRQCKFDFIFEHIEQKALSKTDATFSDNIRSATREYRLHRRLHPTLSQTLVILMYHIFFLCLIRCMSGEDERHIQILYALLLTSSVSNHN